MMKTRPSDLKASGDLALADSATTRQHSWNCFSLNHLLCYALLAAKCTDPQKDTSQCPTALHVLTLEYFLWSILGHLMVFGATSASCSVWWVPRLSWIVVHRPLRMSLSISSSQAHIVLILWYSFPSHLQDRLILSVHIKPYFHLHQRQLSAALYILILQQLSPIVEFKARCCCFGSMEWAFPP